MTGALKTRAEGKEGGGGGVPVLSGMGTALQAEGNQFVPKRDDAMPDGPIK